MKGQGGECLISRRCMSILRGALGLVVELVGLGVFGNVAADEPDLVVFYPGVGLLERDVAFAQTSSPRCRQASPHSRVSMTRKLWWALRFWAIEAGLDPDPIFSLLILPRCIIIPAQCRLSRTIFKIVLQNRPSATNGRGFTKFILTTMH